MKKIILPVAMFICLGLRAQEVNVMEITTEPEDTGKIIYTVMMTPARTQNIELLTFECTYHQEFPFEDSTGRKLNKVHEPEVFTYKARNVKLVSELDYYVNFRVPVKLELLKPIYGEKMFNDKYPITVSTIKITAKSGNDKLWELTVPAKGRFAYDKEKKQMKEVDSKFVPFSDRSY